MSSKLSRNQSRIRRHARVRKKISGTPECPRTDVFRSNAHIEVQIIDDVAGNTLVSASSVQMKLENGGNIEAAQKVGAEIAKRALEKNIKKVVNNMKFTFQKVGLVKYDAFNEMGGKLSFSLALLNASNDGFVLNAVHSREGCYTYIKEIIDGNSIIVLAQEEQEALNMAMEAEKPATK